MTSGDIPIRTVGFWPRLLAFVIDAIVVATFAAILGLATGLLAPARFPARAGNAFDYLVDVWNAQPGLLLGPLLLFVVLLFLHDALLTALRGATPGHRALGMAVVDRRGRRPSLLRATARAALRLVSLGALGVGALWCAVQRDRRTWHDLLAGTWVVRRPPPRG